MCGGVTHTSDDTHRELDHGMSVRPTAHSISAMLRRDDCTYTACHVLCVQAAPRFCVYMSAHVCTP